MKKITKNTTSKTKRATKKVVKASKTLEPVIDEVHWIQPGETIRLERDNIVRGSFVSNLPVVVNYNKATITAPSNFNEEREVVVSYLYRKNGE